MNATRSARKPAVVEGPAATMAVQVATDIAQRIIGGIYPPGTNLREIPLAEDFGVSRTSIREAFRILEERPAVKAPDLPEPRVRR